MNNPDDNPEDADCCDHPGYTCAEFEDMLDLWDSTDD